MQGTCSQLLFVIFAIQVGTLHAIGEVKVEGFAPHIANLGKDCWGACGKDGPCSFCGGGSCCRKDWNHKLCEGAKDYANHHGHQCVVVPSSAPVQPQPQPQPQAVQQLQGMLGDKCWDKCGKDGPCSFCGSGAACCRKDWNKDACQGAQGYTPYHGHQCVTLPSQQQQVNSEPQKQTPRGVGEVGMERGHVPKEAPNVQPQTQQQSEDDELAPGRIIKATSVGALGIRLKSQGSDESSPNPAPEESPSNPAPGDTNDDEPKVDGVIQESKENAMEDTSAGESSFSWAPVLLGLTALAMLAVFRRDVSTSLGLGQEKGERLGWLVNSQIFQEASNMLGLQGNDRKYRSLFDEDSGPCEEEDTLI